MEDYEYKYNIKALLIVQVGVGNLLGKSRDKYMKKVRKKFKKCHPNHVKILLIPKSQNDDIKTELIEFPEP